MSDIYGERANMPKITTTRIREIVNEELHRAVRLHESATGPDHEATARVVGAASKLLKALTAFTEATDGLPAVMNATHAGVETLQKTLAQMIEAPTSYAKKPSEPKVVKLRAQADGATL